MVMLPAAFKARLVFGPVFDQEMRSPTIVSLVSFRVTLEEPSRFAKFAGPGAAAREALGFSSALTALRGNHNINIA